MVLGVAIMAIAVPPLIKVIVIRANHVQTIASHFHDQFRWDSPSYISYEYRIDGHSFAGHGFIGEYPAPQILQVSYSERFPQWSYPTDYFWATVLGNMFYLTIGALIFIFAHKRGY